jgi:nitroreductase
MEISSCIKKRRTVKEFLNKKIKKLKLNQILDSLRYAPNAGNLQNWRLIVIDNKEIKEKLVKTSFNQSWINQAPILIVVCSDNQDITRYFGKDSFKKYAIQNCAAGIQNMLLKAYSLGISSCWCAISDEDKVRKILKIPGKISLEAIICLGYSKDEIKMPKRLPLKNILHFNKW